MPRIFSVQGIKTFYKFVQEDKCVCTILTHPIRFIYIRLFYMQEPYNQLRSIILYILYQADYKPLYFFHARVKFT